MSDAYMVYMCFYTYGRTGSAPGLYVEAGHPNRFAPCCRARPALRRMHAALWGRRSAALLGIGR